MPEDLQFIPFEEKNRELIKLLIKELYFSPAVIHKPSETIINNIVCACFDRKTNVDGYEIVLNNNVIGYFIISFSFSTEYGTNCAWLEDLYIKSEYRNRGFGTKVFDFIKNEYVSKGYRVRLEVEKSNLNAIYFYKKNGLTKSEYFVMEINSKNWKIFKSNVYMV